jgi:hypothetical protein
MLAVRHAGTVNANANDMRVLPDKMPRPRLLYSLEPDPLENTAPDDKSESDTRRKGAGKRRWIFTGMLAAVFVFLIAGFFGSRPGSHAPAVLRKLIEAGTRSLSASPHSSATPDPVIVRFQPEMIHVSAIALGHPRLAVINDKPVSEGDVIIVHSPTHSVAVTLRVVKIADGRIELSDGSHVFTAHLTLPSAGLSGR